MEDARIRNIEATVKRIEQALTGNLDDTTSVGLVEMTRTHSREIQEIKAVQNKLVPEVAELSQFRRDIKKIVIGIGAIIPFLFEVLKLGGAALWDYFMHNPHKP